LPGHVLIVCQDAGGNIPPLTALAWSLGERGHRVSILSQPSVRARARAAGCGFLPFSAVPDYRPDQLLEDQLDIAGAVLVGPSVGDDLIAAVAAQSVDLLIVDADLAGALAAAEALDQPSVVLFHHMYATYVDTWLADYWPGLSEWVNLRRQEHGLDAAAGWGDLFAGHARLLSVVPAVFDAPAEGLLPTMRHFGFLVGPAASSGSPVGFPDGDGPAVLVSLSTSHHPLQEQLLVTIVDALGRLPVRALVTTSGQWEPASGHRHPNVTVTDYVPHASLLGHTDLVVTHGGLGTVAAALAGGVPLVCAPLGRDQLLNAGRVTDLGAGVTVDAAGDADDVQLAVETVLHDDRYREGAASIAEASRREGGPAAAAADIESLLG
jgi:UDP:flavonoid glycosyltransferase YjiC (YdhE family)